MAETPPPDPSPLSASRRLPLGAAALLVLVFAAWGAQQAAIKIGNAEMAPIFQAGLRSLGATLLLTLWFALRGSPPWRMGVRPWEALALGLLFTLDFALLFLGLDQTTASRGTILYYTGPILIAVGAAALLPAERIGRRGIAGFVLAFAGVAAVLWRNAPSGDGDGGGALAGDLLCLSAAAAWAATILLVKTTRLVEVPASAALYFQLAGSAVALPLVSLVAGESWSLPRGTAALSALGFQVIVVAFASYLVFFWMLRRYAAATLSAFSFLAPVFGVLFGAALLGDAVTPSFALGALLVVTGLYLVTRDGR